MIRKGLKARQQKTFHLFLVAFSASFEYMSKGVTRVGTFCHPYLFLLAIALIVNVFSCGKSLKLVESLSEPC